MTREKAQNLHDLNEFTEIDESLLEGLAGGGEESLEQYNGYPCSACGKTNTVCTAKTGNYIEYQCNSCGHLGIHNIDLIDMKP